MKRTKEINKRIAIILLPLEPFFYLLEQVLPASFINMQKADKFSYFDVVGEQLMLFSHSKHAKYKFPRLFNRQKEDEEVDENPGGIKRKKRD